MAIKDVTILIPTYNRTDYLLRLLRYYASFDFSANILVLDSSDIEARNRHQQIICDTSCGRMRWKGFDQELHMYHKLAEGSSYVNTPYCAICADDDFLVPEGLDECSNFLDKNPDYAIADGYFFYFWLEMTIHKTSSFHWKTCYPHKSLDQEDPLERASSQLMNYNHPTFYSLHRTDVLQRVLDINREKGDLVHFGEILPSILSLIEGKAKYLDVLYSGREFMRGPLQRHFNPSHVTWKDYISNGQFKKYFPVFIDALVDHFRIYNPQVNPETAGEWLDKAFYHYLCTCKILQATDQCQLEYIKHQNTWVQEEKLRMKKVISDPAGTLNVQLARIRNSVLRAAIVLYNGGCSRIVSSTMPEYLQKQAEFDYGKGNECPAMDDRASVYRRPDSREHE